MPDEKREIALMQMQRAQELLKEVSVLIEVGAYNSAVNRAYYAAFHAIKALEALEGFDSRKHSGAVSHFRQGYIKTGLLPAELSKIIELLQIARGDSDYNISVHFTSEEAAMQFDNAKTFVAAIEEYLQTQT